ncbi:hypothetical protein VV869_07005 [Photobacterium sp. MCCC 1A19761]|uniref:hypothetical protein n=1 Tax=Photobacterium sp. MCCC 1A19761 TaxID=3115000 RepID=UPI00307D6E7B
MLQDIEDTLRNNRLKYDRSDNTIRFKFSSLSTKINIDWNEASNSCTLNCGETKLALSSFLVFFSAFLILPSSYGILGYMSAGLLISGGVINLCTLVLTQIKLLDLKAQLRANGIYL